MITDKNYLTGQRDLSIISQAEIFFTWGFRHSPFVEYESCDFLLVNISWLHCSTEGRGVWRFPVNTVFSEEEFCSLLFIPAHYRQSFLCVFLVSVLLILERLVMETLFYTCSGLTLASSQAPIHLLYLFRFSAQQGEKIRQKILWVEMKRRR